MSSGCSPYRVGSFVIYMRHWGAFGQPRAKGSRGEPSKRGPDRGERAGAEGNMHFTNLILYPVRSSGHAVC
jgi:hypothetical protein